MTCSERCLRRTRVTSTWYEVFTRVVRVGGDGASQSVLVYAGHDHCCTMVGLRPGCVYRFSVRAVSPGGAATEESLPIVIKTLLPTLRHVRLLPTVTSSEAEIKWKACTFSGEVAASARNEWKAKVHQWTVDAHQHGEVRYSLKIVHIDPATRKRHLEKVVVKDYCRHRFYGLIANCRYSVSVRVEFELKHHLEGSSSIMVSPWSSPITFITRPDAPSQPAVVWSHDSGAVLRWQSGSTFVAKESYRCELQQLDLDGVDVRREWSIVYEGSSDMAVLCDLDTRFAYRARVFAANASGDMSIPGLPTQFSLTSRPSRNIVRPSKALQQFTLRVSDRDIVCGDMIIFTEDTSSFSKCTPSWNTAPSVLRTIAARLVRERGAERIFTLLVEWSSVAHDADCKTRERLLLTRDEKITRDANQIFFLESAYPIHRMPWQDESMRWTHAEECTRK